VAVSFISGGNRRKPPTASHLQTLSHEVVSSTLHHDPDLHSQCLIWNLV